VKKSLEFGKSPQNLHFSLKIVEIWLDLVEILLDLACFCRFGRIFYMALVEFELLGFWRSKPATQLASVGS